MMRESRDARQDRALVALLQALPEERLERIMHELGIEPEKVAERGHKIDLRRCKVCSLGYVACRAQDDRAEADDRHDWTPDRTRTGERL